MATDEATAIGDARPVRSHLRSALLVLLGGAMLGSAGAASSYAPDEATVLGVGFLRLVVGSTLLLCMLPFLGGSWRGIPALLRRRTVWIAALCTAGFQPLFFTAVERAGVALTTLIAVGASPVVAGFVGWAVLHQRPNARWGVATAIAVLGLVVRSWGDLHVDDAFGVLLALGTAVCVGCYVVSTKAELEHGGHAVEVPTATYLLAAVMLAPFALAQPLAWATTPTGLAVVLYLGVMTMALGNFFAIRGMQGLGPGPSSTLLLSDPLVATLLGVVLLGEPFPLHAAIGLALVVVGLVLQARAAVPEPFEPPLA